MQKSPFKFLDSFTKEDREIFFGRDKEIEELHSRVFESKILIVYGTSGTGKTSLINCGLANKFNDADWLPVNIRRRDDINQSLVEALSKNALTKAPFEKTMVSKGKTYNLEKLIRSVYLDHFKPVFLIFDQFEELFIFGQKEEKNELIRNISRVLDSDAQCRFIFSLREEYLAGITEFEKVIPSFLSNRIRIEKMTRQNAIQTIEGPCRVNNIDIESGFAETLLEKLDPDSPEVELTWLQVFLDKLFRLAVGEDNKVHKISKDLFEKLGDVKDILGAFLEEQISQLADPETGLVILKSFVSIKGTKQQITEDEVIEYTSTFGKTVDSEIIKESIQRFIGLRILRDKDENGRYELRHDSLASKIYEKITLVEKELLEIKYFIENAYANYEKRHLLLSEEDLKYIAPYEDKLFLNEKSLRFISQSKWALQKNKRRRQIILTTGASVLFIILSLFTIWAMRERANAVKLKLVAVTQKNTALRAKEIADSARQMAIVSQNLAIEKENQAVLAQKQSDKDRKTAITERENALKEKARAEQLSVIANEQARKAEQEKQIADQQKILAQNAEEKAKRLSLLSTAQSLALKSFSMDERISELMGLMAVQAFNFNRRNGGTANDPVIFKALDKSFSILDRSKHSIFRGSANEIWSLAEKENTIVSADFDGNILQWDSIGNYSVLPNSKKSSYIALISLNPVGDKLVTVYEDDKIILKDLLQSSIETELKGHNGQVSIAAWSNDGKYLATAGKDSLIIIWNTDINPVVALKTFKAESEINALFFCNKDTLISANEGGKIYLWNIQNSTSELLFTSKLGQPGCLAWNRLDKTLYAGCSNGVMEGLNLNKRPLKPLIDQFSASGITHIVFSKDYSLMAITSWDKVIRVYNNGDRDIPGAVFIIDNLKENVRSIMITDDNRVVAGMSDSNIRIWEPSSLKLASMICNLVKRDLTISEWTEVVGKEIPYEKTCGRNQ